jgi:hypothetical protein
MTVRREFIGGMLAALASPTVAKARIFKEWPWVMYDGETLTCMHFDFTKGRGFTRFLGCLLIQCSFACDETTSFVELSYCTLIDTDISALGKILPENTLRLERNAAAVTDAEPGKRTSCEPAS